MGMSLQDFIARLDGYTARVPLDELEQLMREVELDVETVRSYITFSPGHYTRNPIALGSAYQALVLCWLPGQESVIHDHSGSSCGVRVLEGVCTEVPYAWSADGTLSEQPACALQPGAICGTQDSDIHKISNLENGPLITLHVYSPPLEIMNTYKASGECVGVVHIPAQNPQGSPALTATH